MAKIDIISGFLGAGKTTLIKKLLEESLKKEQVVLIENEFGEIGIDGGFLKDAGINITEMNSGCICCSLVGDFGTALKDVIDQFNPDRVIIEPSGVGKLSDVIKAVQGVGKEAPIELNSLVTVADAKKCKMYMKNFGEFYNNQVESAHTIVLSRTQEMSEDKLEACVAMLREHNEDAAIITTPWDDLTGDQLLSAMEKPVSLADIVMEEEDIGEEEEHEHEHEHHHHHEEGDHDADDVFTSWGKETPRKYTKDEVENILKTLSESSDYGVILRSKGMLPNVDGTWIYFDMVPGEYEIRQGDPEYTGRLCVIGSEIDEDKLAELFLIK